VAKNQTPAPETTAAATATETEEQQVFTREDGTQYTVEPFNLGKTKEIADRFRNEAFNVNIPLPVVGETDEATLANLRAFVHPEATFRAVLVGKFNGQGIRLDIQKVVKEFLAPRDAEDKTTVEVDGEQVPIRDAPVEEVLVAAQGVADGFRLGMPRAKGTGGSKGKVAAAEAKVAKTANLALDMYRRLPVEMRAEYRDGLIETGQVTAEQLDEIDAE
jgi:hypothetical protein